VLDHLYQRVDVLCRPGRGSASLRISSATTVNPLLLSGPRRFDGGVDGKQVRLVGHVVYHIGYLADLL